ncbi:MAG: beta-ketoacyl-[acyl-carrier-protein] synthase family protein [Firmicutes bacterium]|nr:beta-ketoacyl-[acyl-carrier-protein] synthase family protein [Bacillota bacterium]
MSKKLVITGMGAVTPIGIGVDNYWENLIAGETGIDYITGLDIEELPVKFAGQVKDFNPKDYMPRKLSSEMDRFMQMAYVAAGQALEGYEMDPYRTGITVGTALNGICTITETERAYESSPFKKVGPRFLPKSLGNVCASQIAIANDIHGPSMTLNTACASGGDAIALAAMMINAGKADAMVVVGAESGIDPILIQSLYSAQALSTRNDDPKKASRPFDVNRDGFVFGEGAGALLIETEEHAKARGAKIYAELAGCGNNTDAYHPVTPRPDGEGEILCMKEAMEMAGIKPSDIGYINTHGTSTHKGDIVETNAVKELFGEAAYELVLNSTKGATGHMMGAGGITEVITCIKAIETGIIPATLNLEEKDPECDLNYVSVNTEKEINYAMSNAFGFGGQNSSIIVGRY